MSDFGRFTTLDSSNFDSYHKSAESDFSLAFSRIGKSFVGSQEAFLSGKPPFNGDLLSPFFTPNGLLITSAHDFLGRMMRLHSNGFKRPFGLIDKKVDAFFQLLRHCADRSEWNPILKLEDAIADFKKDVDDSRSKPMGFYDLMAKAVKLGDVIDMRVLDLCEAIQHRERNIKMGCAGPSVTREGAQVQQLVQLCFVFDEAAARSAADDSKLNTLENGLAKTNSKLASVEKTVVSLATGKKERKSLKLSERALKYALALWQNSRHAQGWAHIESGRAVSKRTVYNHHKAKLNELGIQSAEDFVHAIDNARKQFPDLCTRHTSRKKSCQPTLL